MGTKEIMKSLMNQIEMPEDGVENILAAREKLEREGNWGKITKLADHVMEEDGNSTVLNQALEDVEHLEDAVGVHKYTLDFLMLMCCWEEVKTRYEQAGLSMEIYYKTLEDMKWKFLECREIYGVDGIFVGHWYGGFFDLTRFGLGRLQFELCRFEGKETCVIGDRCIEPGDWTINMHIPSSGPMTPELLEDAFFRAKDFFRKVFPDGELIFAVSSWLIDPDLISILPEGNIKAFAERFHLIRLDREEEEIFPDGWRVFGAEWKKAPEDLPQNTKLQKAIASYLQQGKKLGSGYGIFVW